MSKQYRHRLILELVQDQPVSSQGELRDLLAARGVLVNQATLSRDIKELGLVKVSEDGVGYRYVRLEDVTPTRPEQSVKLLRQFVRKIDISGSLLVLKTELGNGPPVAVALDRLSLGEVLGTIAGDDTVFAAIADGESPVKVRDYIRTLLKKE